MGRPFPAPEQIKISIFGIWPIKKLPNFGIINFGTTKVHDLQCFETALKEFPLMKWQLKVLSKEENKKKAL